MKNMKTRMTFVVLMDTFLLTLTGLISFLFQVQDYVTPFIVAIIVSSTGIWIAGNYSKLEQKMYGVAFLAIFTVVMYLITGWEIFRWNIIVILVLSSFTGGFIQYLAPGKDLDAKE